jgi:hypothetical protein
MSAAGFIIVNASKSNLKTLLNSIGKLRRKREG